MSAPSLPRPSLGFDAFSAAVAVGVIAGALSVVWPSLDGLTAALAALAVAAVAVRHADRPRADGWRPTARGLAVVAVCGAAAGLFLDPPPPLAAWRGMLLGLSLVPWWMVERRRPIVGRAPVGSGA
ncbi:MAG TPA: hypothetical protein VMG36_02525 [Thermoplasmata archaeon]|nr:hypothetical protein [Thermoplasmata archaeon]